MSKHHRGPRTRQTSDHSSSGMESTIVGVPARFDISEEDMEAGTVKGYSAELVETREDTDVFKERYPEPSVSGVRSYTWGPDWSGNLDKRAGIADRPLEEKRSLIRSAWERQIQSGIDRNGSPPNIIGTGVNESINGVEFDGATPVGVPKVSEDSENDEKNREEDDGENSNGESSKQKKITNISPDKNSYSTGDNINLEVTVSADRMSSVSVRAEARTSGGNVVQSDEKNISTGTGGGLGTLTLGPIKDSWKKVVVVGPQTTYEVDISGGSGGGRNDSIVIPKNNGGSGVGNVGLLLGGAGAIGLALTLKKRGVVTNE